MNKHIKFLLILIFFLSYSIAQIEQPKISTLSLESIEYFNAKFKFKVSVPNDWRLHNEKEDGRKNLTIQWLLPKTYDSIQNKYINSTI